MTELRKAYLMVLQKILKHYLSQSGGYRQSYWIRLYCFLAVMLSVSDKRTFHVSINIYIQYQYRFQM